MWRHPIGRTLAVITLTLCFTACEGDEPTPTEDISTADVASDVEAPPDISAETSDTAEGDTTDPPDGVDIGPEDVESDAADTPQEDAGPADADDPDGEGEDVADTIEDVDAGEELPPPGCISDEECDAGGPCEVGQCDQVNGECLLTPVDDDTPCDDGNLCSEGDHCASGKCVGSTALDCDDQNPCTDDICNPQVGCTHGNNFSTCDDGDSCTGGDHCVGGVCVTDTSACTDDSDCTDDICDPLTGECSFPDLDGQPCDDGSECTLGDICEGASCVAGQADGCADDNACTIDTCKDGVCSSQPAAGEACDDGDACTEGDVCVGEVCASGAPLDCDDQNVCTVNTCDSAVGCQIEVLPGIDCDDEDACTDVDVCDEAGTCVSGDAVECDDGNPCTDDNCNAQVGCKLVNNTEPCSDGDPCSLGDECQNGTCTPASTACFDDDQCTEDVCGEDGCDWTDLSGGCDDGNSCTDDTCNATSGCENSPNTLSCDDGDICTDDDTCADGTCTGSAIDCNSGDPCIADSCDPTDGCQSEPITGSCDDGDACTEDTSCDDDGLCTGGTSVAYEDTVDCTLDACDPIEGVTHTPDHSQCLLGQFCDPVAGCLFGEIELLITKVMVWPHDGEAQWFQMTNYGENPVDLRALTLTDGAGVIGAIASPSGEDEPVIILPGGHAAGVHADQLSTAPASGISFVFGSAGDGFDLPIDAPVLTLSQGSEIIDNLSMIPVSTGPTIGSNDFPVVQGTPSELTSGVVGNIKDQNSNEAGSNWCAWADGSTGPGGATLDCTRSRVNEVHLGNPADTRFVEVHMPVGAQTNIIKIRILNATGQPVKLTKVGAGRVGTDGLPFISSDTTSLAPMSDGVVQLFYGSVFTDVYGFGDVTVAVDPFVGHPTYEGAPGPALEADVSAQRTVDGVDSDDNSGDWSSATPSPGEYNTP